MKRYLIFLAVTLCAVISCSQEEVLKTDEVKLVPATIVAESSDFGTKTTATWNSEEQKYNIKWEADDALSVFTNKDTDNHRFTAMQTGKLATFTGELPENADKDNIYPIMPYDKDAHISGTTVYTSVPAEQNGDFYNVILAGWPRPDTKAEEDFFYQFEAVSGIIKFTFDQKEIAKFEGKDQHVVRLSITADVPIAGDAQISFSDSGAPVMTADPNGTGSNMYNTITIAAPDGATSLADGDYYIATLPIKKIDFPDGLPISVKCETKEGEVAYINTTIGKAGKNHILTANVVKNIGTVKTTNYVPHITSGEFTVDNKGRKVSFSSGNLQYRASDNRWRFAPNQYDAQGEVGNLTRPASDSEEGDRMTQSDWIDLFPYGHSGFTYNGTEYKIYDGTTYQPYQASHQSGSYFISSFSAKDLTGEFINGDWGVYHYGEIYDGNSKSQEHWRLLTHDEADYMMNKRTVNKVKYQKTEWVSEDYSLHYMRCGIKTGQYDKGVEIVRYCLMLFPDGYEWPTKIDLPIVKNSKVNRLALDYDNLDNNYCPKYNLTELAVFESGGVVLLPCAGHRLAATGEKPFPIYFVNCSADGELSSVSSFDQEGHYWTSTGGYALVNRSANANELETYTSPADAKSVRLVKNGTGF